MAVLMAELRLHKVLACTAHLLVVCFLIQNTFAAASEQNTSCYSSDHHALISFAAGLRAAVFATDNDGGRLAMNESWKSERDCCSWWGINCTHIAQSNSSYIGRVTALSLDFDELSVSSSTVLESLCNLPLLSTLHLYVWEYIQPSTSVPLQLPECFGGQLPLLRVLELDSLNLKGSIPSSFSRFLHLQTLSLDSNPDLSGPLLPDLFHLPSLTCISLYYCSFSGHLPTFNTPLLQSLCLSGNYFNSTLEQFTLLSTLTSLTALDLSDNSISGPIPSSIARLSSLQSLLLARNSLSGALPDSLCKLSHLLLLDLSDNFLSMAESLQNCTLLINLTYLDLSSNNLSGPFPAWIGHLSSLEELFLSSNHFAGPLPHEWQKLQKLRSIHLGSGNGTGLPEWLFRLPHLAELHLMSMGLQSEDVLCSTKVSMLNNTLRVLDLSRNNISGTNLLECFGLHNFSQLFGVFVDENPLSISLSHVQLPPLIQSLSLGACNLTGFLDTNIFEGRASLNLSHNSLVGKIPTQQANLTATLMSLDLSYNLLTGFDSSGSFRSLGTIDLSHNMIAGALSTVLLSLGFLNCSTSYAPWSLRLSYNNLVGQIPASLAKCANDLFFLHLDHNNISGRIPPNFGEFRSITSIMLTNNYLERTIPPSLITTISVLDVSFNDLEGDLKTLFSFLTAPSNLIVLSLAHNRISGSIPPFLRNFTPTLYVIDLSYNNLIGKIPQDLYLPSFENVEISATLYTDYILPPPLLGEFPLQLVLKGVEMNISYVFRALRFLDLSMNHLEGVIPCEAGNLFALRDLNLSHDSLSGPIPEAFVKLSMLESLALSFNKLEGPIPPSLANLSKLEIFNVSYNEALVGPVPLGSQLVRNESYIGDPHLCGYPVLQKACPVSNGTNVSNSTTINIDDDKVATWIDRWISIPGLCLGIVVGFLGVLWLLHRLPLP